MYVFAKGIYTIFFHVLYDSKRAGLSRRKKSGQIVPRRKEVYIV